VLEVRRDVEMDLKKVECGPEDLIYLIQNRIE
jgi:hypothetical protein